MNAPNCPHEKTRLRKRAGVPEPMAQRQCLNPKCLQGVGLAVPLRMYNATQQRVLEPWADSELGFEPGPRAA